MSKNRYCQFLSSHVAPGRLAEHHTGPAAGHQPGLQTHLEPGGAFSLNPSTAQPEAARPASRHSPGLRASPGLHGPCTRAFPRVHRGESPLDPALSVALSVAREWLGRPACEVAVVDSSLPPRRRRAAPPVFRGDTLCGQRPRCCPCPPGAAGTPAHQPAWGGRSQHSRCPGGEQLGRGCSRALPRPAPSSRMRVVRKDVAQREHLRGFRKDMSFQTSYSFLYLYH